MYSPYIDPSILFALVMIFLLMFIPSMFFSGLATLLFCLVDRIPGRRFQIAVVLAVGTIFILGERPFHIFVYNTLGANELMLLGPLFSLVDAIPLAFILETGTIVSFLLIRDHLGLHRAWTGVFTAGSVAITIDFLKNFMISMGPHQGQTSALWTMPYIEIIGRTSEVVLIFVIASAVFGALIFFRQANTLAASHSHRRGILAAVVIFLLITLPSTAAGGLAVYSAALLSKCSGRLVPILVSLVAMIACGIGGSLLMGIDSIEQGVSLFIIPTIIMALAAVIPFIWCAQSIPKTWQPVLLLAGTTAADLALSAIATLLNLGDRLTSDPLTILTFAEGGIIFAALAFAVGKFLVSRHDHTLQVPVAEETS